MTIKDKAGHELDGSQRYRLNVPANPPVRLYWSATAYDRATHALIRNMPWASRSSITPGLEHNPDGSLTSASGRSHRTGTPRTGSRLIRSGRSR